jgi:hypothetical protein
MLLFTHKEKPTGVKENKEHGLHVYSPCLEKRGMMKVYLEIRIKIINIDNI